MNFVNLLPNANCFRWLVDNGGRVLFVVVPGLSISLWCINVLVEGFIPHLGNDVLISIWLFTDLEVFCCQFSLETLLIFEVCR